MPNCLEELFHSNTYHFHIFDRTSYFYIAIELSNIGCSPSYILLTPYVQPKLKEKEVCSEKQVNHSALCVSKSENEKAKRKRNNVLPAKRERQNEMMEPHF